jgi:hypothetical protein
MFLQGDCAISYLLTWEVSQPSLPIAYVGHDYLCKTLLVRPSYLEEGTPRVALRTRQSGVAFHVAIAHH